MPKLHVFLGDDSNISLDDLSNRISMVDNYYITSLNGKIFKSKSFPILVQTLKFSNIELLGNLEEGNYLFSISESASPDVEVEPVQSDYVHTDPEGVCDYNEDSYIDDYIYFEECLSSFQPSVTDEVFVEFDLSILSREEVLNRNSVRG